MASTKAKVCFVTPFFYPVIGGVEKHILESAKELIKMGYKVEVITSDLDRKGKIKKEHEIYRGIEIKRIKSWFRISFGEIFMPGIFDAVRKSDADIFHFHGLRHMYNLAEFSTKKPCVITPHWPDYKGQRSFFIQLIIDTLDFIVSGKMLNRCSAICEVSELEEEWLVSLGADRKKIILTPNAISDEFLRKHDGRRFRNKYNLGERITVLSLSRIHKSKGLDQIIKVAPKFPNVNFVIMGKDGGAEKSLKEIASKLHVNNVIFAGQVNDKEKMEAYAGSDIFCAPSHFEAFNISLLEAMSQGCAPITSDKGGMPWVSGKSGLTFVDEDIEDLKIKLEKVIQNKKLREKMQKSAVERAKDFSWKKTASILDKAYKKALDLNK